MGGENDSHLSRRPLVTGCSSFAREEPQPCHCSPPLQRFGKELLCVFPCNVRLQTHRKKVPSALNHFAAWTSTVITDCMLTWQFSGPVWDLFQPVLLCQKLHLRWHCARSSLKSCERFKIKWLSQFSLECEHIFLRREKHLHSQRTTKKHFVLMILASAQHSRGQCRFG